MSLLDARAYGAVAICGGPGSGRTTALEHLASVLPRDEHLVLVDEPDSAHDDVPMLAKCGLVVYATTAPPSQGIPYLAVFSLAPWGREEAIRYLLPAHKERCGSVMRRLVSGNFPSAADAPEIWRLVLDQLAKDECLLDAEAALRQFLAERLKDDALWEQAQKDCLRLARDAEKRGIAPHQDLCSTFGDEIARILRHRPSLLMLAAERIKAGLCSGSPCDFLESPLPRELVRSAAKAISHNALAETCLERILEGPPNRHAMAASLRMRLRDGWYPNAEKVPHLAGAYLENAAWPSVRLPGVNLYGADLSNANLTGSVLDDSSAQYADFSRARLGKASMERIVAASAIFAGADLTAVRAAEASFVAADFEAACLNEADLREAIFKHAKVRNATFRGAILCSAKFEGAEIAEADFSDANLHQADLAGLVLREACFRGANFRGAKMMKCDLEGMDLPNAVFRAARLNEALLTGSSMPGADFEEADLANTGLADINWEDANLRNANLEGASFHLGSTRGGLVGSPIAREGSMTGFYTDDYEEQNFKAPEEIRKANLRGADLRGANVEETDFYLVDLRDALYDPEQERHFKRCGAILESRV